MDFYLVAALGFLISLLSVFVVMKPFIEILKNHNITQAVSEFSLEEYKAKAKTPIMGGLLFVILPVACFLIIDYKATIEKEVLLVLFSFLLFCLVGFIDDILIIIRKDNEGISASVKLVMEFFFTIILFIIFRDVLTFSLDIPILDIQIDLRWYFYLPVVIIMYLGEANAVNFTDGMDGLCAGVSFISLIAYLVFTYQQSYYNLFILIICVMGGLLAYLYYNHFPAKVFMGDSGSLALGALFSSLALITNTEIVLLVVGGVFLIEMLCVCLQQVSVRLFKKRIFSYTPIHYAFSLKGYKETKIVKCFYLVAVVFTVIGILLVL